MSKQKVIIRKRNSDIEAGYGPKETRNNERAIRKIEEKHLLRTRTDLLAQDFESTKNYPVLMLKEIYPESPWMWKVDKYYPRAKDGPLFIDEPGNMEAFHRLRSKEFFLKEKGLRYVLLKPNGTPFEDEEELNKCGPQQQMPYLT